MAVNDLITHFTFIAISTKRVESKKSWEDFDTDTTWFRIVQFKNLLLEGNKNSSALLSSNDLLVHIPVRKQTVVKLKVVNHWKKLFASHLNVLRLLKARNVASSIVAAPSVRLPLSISSNSSKSGRKVYLEEWLIRAHSGSTKRG